MHLNGSIKKELIFEFILYVFGIIAIIKFYQFNTLLTSLILIAWLFGIFLWHKKHDILFFIIGAIVGPIAEIICIQFGVWQYSNPSFLGIPIWLPFAWGLAVMLIKRIAETFVRIEMD